MGGGGGGGGGERERDSLSLSLSLFFMQNIEHTLTLGGLCVCDSSYRNFLSLSIIGQITCTIYI